eukprot:11161803-Ditylum_brightwellii.AAC.1
MECLSKNRCSRAWKLLCSHGISDSMDDDILSQLEEKYPKYKAPIPDQTTGQMAAPHMGVFPEHLNKAIRGLKSDAVLGLGGICNEHITSIVFSDQRDVPPLANQQ